MRTLPRLLLTGLLAAALAACNGGSSDSSTVLATVNGKPITSDMLRAYVRSQTGGQEPELNDMQRQSVIKTLVNMELLSQAAVKAGMDKKPDIAADIAVGRETQLAQADVVQYLKDHQPTEAQLQAAYQDQMKGYDPHEYKARHILVNDEALAKEIIAQLNKGASFATLAAKYSIDPGSKNKGGDLGDWFSPASMVPEFSAALAGLKKNEYTKQPVHSQFGWHVIQLEDVRSAPAPTFEQMHDKLAESLQRKAMSEYLDQLRSAATVVIKDAAPAAATKAPAAKP